MAQPRFDFLSSVAESPFISVRASVTGRTVLASDQFCSCTERSIHALFSTERILKLQSVTLDGENPVFSTHSFSIACYSVTYSIVEALV